GLISPNSGDGWPLCSRPVPGVVNSAPRGTTRLNVCIGFGKTCAGAPAPPPSQLISRRPPGCVPGVLPLLGVPTAARKPSTVAVMDAASPPAAENRMGAAPAD